MTDTTSGSATASGRLDPTFDLLDRPIALGGADDPVLTGPAPETPMLDGRPVEDPRLIAALSVPHVFTRAEVLDRAAKLGGVLRVLGADGASRLIIADTVPAHVRAFAVLAGVRIGLLVADETVAGPQAVSPDAESLTIRPLTPGRMHSAPAAPLCGPRSGASRRTSSRSPSRAGEPRATSTSSCGTPGSNRRRRVRAPRILRRSSWTGGRCPSPRPPHTSTGC